MTPALILDRTEVELARPTAPAPQADGNVALYGGGAVS